MRRVVGLGILCVVLVGCPSVEVDEPADTDANSDSDATCSGAAGDSDSDGVCDDTDTCTGDDATGDGDGDGVCDDTDTCTGDDATGDSDSDGVCDDTDLCTGDDATGDGDGDGVCDDTDVCAGDDATGDSDGDGVCDSLDLCPDFDDAFVVDGDIGGVVGLGALVVDTCGGGDDFFGSCAQGGVSTADDLTYAWTAPYAGTYTFQTTGFNTVLHVNTAGPCHGTQLACNDDGGDLPGFGSSLDVAVASGETVWLSLDGFDTHCGVATLDVLCPDGDDDGVCNDTDICFGDDASGDSDLDHVCDDVDVCYGHDTTGDTDTDGVCDDNDFCVGDDEAGDGDMDGVCDVCVAGTSSVNPRVGTVVCIPRGTFTMGCVAGRDDVTDDCYDDEFPARSVTLTRSYLMMESEVTQDQYAALMGTHPSYASGPNLPVERVTWNDAVAFADAVSVAEGLTPCGADNLDTCDGWRLPTEAEWEYAARGRQSFAFAGSSSANAVAWYWSNANNMTQPVCTRSRNGYGLCDMSGNLWEWTRDWYQDSYVGAPMTDPAGPASGSYRVVRGGSWHMDTRSVRVAVRYGYGPDHQSIRQGFRLVRSGP